ncbi:DNA replication licensing factor mcm2 [Penicillium chermesinum]|nr:DNA replication licensing factor mcm2 [Penicillium chermesinum]
MDPLQPSSSAANRGPRSNARKRSREPDDMSSPVPVAPSSPPAIASSPPMQFEEYSDDEEVQNEEILDIDDADEAAEDEDGIDLFGDDFERDYRAGEKDQYENEHYIDDDGDYEDLDVGAPVLEELADVKAGNITDWVTQPQVLRSMYREFKAFLTDIWGEINSASLEVSYAHLSESKAALSYFLANEPTEVLKVFDQAALDVTLFHYPSYHDIHNEIHVRITDVPIIYTLRQLRQSHLNCLVRVSGVVTRRTGVFPQLKYVMFLCQKCGITLGPFQQESSAEVKISFCQNCQSRGPFQINSEKTLYRNYQKLTLQESPGSVPAGRLPRQREVILLADLIDTAKPGDEIEITGIYRNSYDAQLNNKNGFPVFATIIEANHVVKSHDQMAGFNLTEEDEREIRALSRDPDIVDKIVRSMAPSIYGHYDVKTAVALSLFGGVSKEAQGKCRFVVLKYVEKTAHRAVFATGQGASAVGLTASVRRDPLTSEWTLEGGALVLADRGTCLIDEFDKMNDQDRTSIHEAMEQQTISISKAGIVTTLKARCAVVAAANPTGGRYNATKPFSQNVELTEPILSRFDILCVVRDLVEPSEDERLANFVIESHHRSNPPKPLRNNAGELVNADGERIDEEGFRIDAQGRRLPPTPEEVARRAAEQKKEDEEKEGEIPQELLRKYILYARERCYPKLYQIDQDKIARLFADMRRESLATGAYPITVRHLEAIMRIAEAFCKMRLSEYCSAQDIDRAIAVTVESFIGSQKVSCKKALSRAFAKYVFPEPLHQRRVRVAILTVTCRYTLSRPKPQSKRRAGVAVQNPHLPRSMPTGV